MTKTMTKVSDYFLLWYKFFKNPSDIVRSKVTISYIEILKHLIIAGIIFGIVFSVILPSVGNTFSLKEFNVFSVLPYIGYDVSAILTYLVILIVVEPLALAYILALKIVTVSALSAYILTRKSNFKENLFWSVVFFAPATIVVYLIGLVTTAITTATYFDYYKVSEILLAYFVLSPALVKLNKYSKIASIVSWLPIIILL